MHVLQQRPRDLPDNSLPLASREKLELSDIGRTDRSGRGRPDHVTGPRTSATLVSPLPVRFIIQPHSLRSSIRQAAINTTTMLSTLRRSSLHLAKRKTLFRAAGSSAPRRTLVQPSGADRASVVDVPSTYQDDNLLSPRPGGSTRVRYPRVLFTKSIFFRHAWLQVRGTSPRRNFERKDPTDLSGYAGLTQFDQICPSFDSVFLRQQHL